MLRCPLQDQLPFVLSQSSEDAGHHETDGSADVDDDGQSAVYALLARLADVPTPAGPTPHEIGLLPTVALLPIVQVAQRNTR